MDSIHLGEQAVPARTITLLDGGTGEECFRRGVPDDRKIWSARALLDPQYHAIVRDVHAAFIAAGSRFITTGNYSVTPGVGLSDRLEELTGVAGALAREAREACARRGVTGVRICGSLPPLVESYRPDLVLPHERGVEQYRRIARALQPSADLFLAETMSSVAEALSAVHGAREVDASKDIWVSWTLRSDGRLRSGEPVDVAVRTLLAENVSAILFNCSEPEAILRALERLEAATEIMAALRSAGVRLGAYANRLTPVPEDFAMVTSTAPQAMRDDIDQARYVDIARQWVAFGAELIGGCCGIGPEYIEALRRAFVDPAMDARFRPARAVESLSGTMRAVEFQRGHGATLVTRNVPRVSADEVLIRVAFAGVCGTDLHILQGTSRCGDRVILGHEGSGHIAARGPGVPEHLAVGDAVALHPQFSCGRCVRCRRGQPNFCERGGHASTIGYWHDGCYAEYCVAHWSQVHPVPDRLGLEEAVFCEPFNCVMNGWKKLQEPARDSRILIMGAGIVGLLWASLLHARGYRSGIITEPLAGRRGIAATLCERRLRGFQARSPAELGDERFDVIVECCGSAEAIEDAYRRLDVGGRLLIFGGPPRGSRITIDPSDILYKELTLCGSVIGQDTFAAGIAALIELSAAGYLNLDELGVARFALSDHSDAFQAASEGTITKAILVVGSPSRSSPS